MPPANPFPLSCLLLNLALPGIALFGWALTGRLRISDNARHLLAPALAVAAWVVAIHAIGRTVGSFLVGLAAGTIGVAAMGLGLAWSTRRVAESPVVPPPSPTGAGRDQTPSVSVKGMTPPSGPLPPGGGGLGRGGQEPPAPASVAPAGPPPDWRLMLTTAALATALIAPMALGHEFHDELFVTGHVSIVSEIGRGVYPPRHLTFPQFELRYHYGFNVLVAALCALWRLPTTLSIDVVTLAGFFLSWCLLWAIGQRVAGSTLGGALTALVTLFGGGLPWLVPLGESDSIDRTMTLSSYGGVNLNPPIISYVFQHPWSLGLPLGLAVLLLHLEAGRSVWRTAALGLLLVALAVSQFVLFACLSATLVAAEAWNAGRPSLRRGAVTLGAVALAMACASQLGGFFLRPDPQAESAIVPHAGVADSPGESVVWHFAAFGLLLPLGAAGAIAARRGRPPFILLAVGGLLVINTLRYRYSWDIMKFATVAALGMSVLAAAALARLVPRRDLAGPWLVGLLALGATAAGLVYPLVFLVAPGMTPEKGFRLHPMPLDEAERQAASWLAPRMPPGEIMYTRVDRSLGYAQSAGLPQAFFDAAVPSFGFAPARLDARMRLLAEPPDDPDPFAAEGIRWFVLAPRDRINPQVDRWIRQGQAREEARFGSLRIVRLVR